MRIKVAKIVMLGIFLSLCSNRLLAQVDFRTDYFRIRINASGWITSMQNITVNPHREFSPADKPSPLLSLYDSKKKQYYLPGKAAYNKAKQTFTLYYPNGSVASVKLDPHSKYLKLTLLALSPRNGVDNIQWGAYHTNIANLFGEVIGVARDTSEAVNYAIGMLALNDITIGGTADLEGDAAPFQYIIHSPDKQQYPLPENLQEGQAFPIGGDGINDVAFYAHPEPYYRILYGNAAFVDKDGEIFLTYHARNRSIPQQISFSLIPFLATNKPNHQEVQALPGVDFMGSSIALWGSPDSTALLDVIRNIVLSEHLPYPTINGKWIKDPARYIPDVSARGGRYDSTISYVSQLGFKAIETEDLPFFKVDRGNRGYIDGEHFEQKIIPFSSGKLSHKAFTDLSNPKGILVGRHTITTSLAQGTLDASPVPNDSLCYQLKRVLVKNISPADTLIEIDDPAYLNEIASWEGHSESLNMIKIGRELIHYLGVSNTPPYRLLRIQRGYWGTAPAAHAAGDAVLKMQVTINYGYDGLIPDIYLQDKIAEYYADVSHINGLRFMDLDGQEFLFNSGHGYYSVKRFFHKMFDRAAAHQIPYLRISGATLSEGSWHYQSVWNVGGGNNMYDTRKRVWGSSTSEGKDIRDVAYANYFPATFGNNFGLTAGSTVADFEHVQAISVGVGATYLLELNQDAVESCPQKYEIFKAVRTWEDARAANAFPRWVRKELAKPENQFHLERKDNNTWKLYKTSLDGKNPVLYCLLKRQAGY
ncbi:hypothetical protein [Flavihumibacter fluvii]|uniref:hypothetical protein n=1 Tax=Flavihumibacter fluvii TaxID=2838157 RepID=UPI001BDF2A37|nr:hypothetical protein [Flavihumibacter fluvii]ULQ53407.1 hypothetical protein KJS93_03625 [Flavihumibacter fluvii]